MREVVFEDVNVVPMERPGIVTHRTVVVREGQIAEITSTAAARIPAQALRIPAAGKYLIPGLADMHMHLPGPEADEAALETLLFLYLAHGVTQVRSMAGTPEHLALRERVVSGDLLGPALSVGGPPLTAASQLSPTAFADEVRRQKAAGYDFLKVYPDLSQESYEAISTAAAAAGIRVCGHIPREVGLRGSLAARQTSIEHLDGYVEAIQAEAAPDRSTPLTALCALRRWTRTAQAIQDLAEATAAAAVWNVPTLLISETLRSGEGSRSLHRRAGVRFVAPAQVAAWDEEKAWRLQHGAGSAEQRCVIRLRRLQLKALADQGGKLLLGTDSPNVFVVPGFSLRREMQLRARAGLTPYAILESATLRAAEYLGTSAHSGKVDVGQAADLVLLHGNPLEDVRHAGRIAGVMLRGRWLPASEIRRRLDTLSPLS